MFFFIYKQGSLLSCGQRPPSFICHDSLSYLQQLRTTLLSQRWPRASRYI